MVRGHANDQDDGWRAGFGYIYIIYYAPPDDLKLREGYLKSRSRGFELPTGTTR